MGDFSQHCAQRLQQRRWRHRFGQYHRQLNALPAGFFAGLFATKSSDHDYRWRFQQFGGLHLPHRLHAIHARHAPIHQHQVIGQPLGFGFHQHGQCGSTTLRDVHFDTKTARHGGQNLARRGVVVDNQHTATHQFVGGQHAA
ncbi:hypothetical protein D3C81_1590340 [compost metagenome]